jgi:hypothetical protein
VRECESERVRVCVGCVLCVCVSLTKLEAAAFPVIHYCF